MGVKNNLKIHGSAHVTRLHSSANKVQPNLVSWVSRVLLEGLPDEEKITSDGMINKQTETFNF